MKHEKLSASLLLAVLAFSLPAWAEDAEKAPGQNASVSGKNEIPICPKLIPIEVALDPKYSDANRAEVVDKYEVPSRIEHAVACELQRQGYGTVKPFQLKIRITNFRLRSGGSASMLGIMAGVDKLAISVDVSVDQSAPLQFDLNTSTTQGGLSMPAPAQRLNAMVQKLARDMIATLDKRDLLKKA